MSSSEAENFDLDIASSDESDGFAPPTKKTVRISSWTFDRVTSAACHLQTKAPAKKAAKPAPKAAKAPAKPKGATKKKVLAPKDRNADESFGEVDEDDSDDGGPVLALASNGRKKDKTASETYQKVCVSPNGFTLPTDCS